MALFKFEYRERAEGPLLKSVLVTAVDTESTEAEAKREFTLIQANLGARQYAVFDEAGVLVASHQTPDGSRRDR